MNFRNPVQSPRGLPEEGVGRKGEGAIVLLAEKAYIKKTWAITFLQA